MTNNHKLLAALSGCLLFISTSCSRDKAIYSPDAETKHPSTEEEFTMELPESLAVPGEILIKLSSSPASENSLSSIEQAIGSTLRSATPIEITPVFDISGPMAPAMRREGLDRWYKVSLEDYRGLRSALTSLRSMGDEIEVAEPNYKVVRLDSGSEGYFGNLRAGESHPVLNSGYAPFTNSDPYLKYQWHYQNDGGSDGYEKGADINLFEAWKTETGKPSVIVAVMDEGIYYEHEDLRESMWDNPDNAIGVHGTHGKNFCNNSYEIDWGFHGTHTAGTIAARNNNGIGISGVAGGDGTPKSGVRLMSCQIIAGQKRGAGVKGQNASSDQIGQAFIWAANNGAVISNNSWGFAYDPNNAFYYPKETPQAIKEGIDYFIKYAGCDASGNQRPDSPMKGGVVIFATGNDAARNVKIVPASYEPVVAVSSFTPNYTIASYANVGPFVNLLAPGGLTDPIIFKGVLSTVTPNFGEVNIGDSNYPVWGRKYLLPESHNYAYANGTSMAAPHVTGIAALIVSHYGVGKKGFTNEDLKKRLLAAIKPLDHEKKNPSYVGLIGRGYVDASLVFEDDNNKAPEAVTKVTTKAEYEEITVTWSPTKDADARNGYTLEYLLYLGEEELTNDFSNALTQAMVRGNDTTPGVPLSYTFHKLSDSKSYHLAIVARDRWGHTSSPFRTEIKTKVNAAPLIPDFPKEPLVISKSNAFHRITLKVQDPEGHAWKYKELSPLAGVKMERQGDELRLLVVPVLNKGEYKYAFLLTDERGKSQRYDLPIIIANSEPLPIKSGKETLIIHANEKEQEIDLRDLVESGQDARSMTFRIDNGDPSLATVTLKEDHILVVTPHKIGESKIAVRGIMGETIRATELTIIVSEKNFEPIQELFPIPTTSLLHYKIYPSLKEVTIVITNTSGRLLLRQKAKPNQQHLVSVDVSKFVPGVYTTIIETPQGTSRKTFIKN